jgi:hypothetical protein
MSNNYPDEIDDLDESNLSKFYKAAKRASQDGMAGAAAMTINIVSFMWLTTTIKYQYRYGTSTVQALKTLYKDGGVLRLYLFLS